MRNISYRRAVAFAITTAAVSAALCVAALLTAGHANGATIARCPAQHLSLSLGQPKAAAGTTDYTLTFTNNAGTCTLYGYPGVSAVKSPAGPEVGPPAARSAGRSVLVVLKHGGKATAMLGVANTGNYPPSRCRARTANGLRAYPPNAFDALFVRLRVSVCTLTPSMSVTPVRIGS